MLKRHPRFLKSSHFTCLISTQKPANWSSAREKIPSDPVTVLVAFHGLRDGHWTGTAQTENTVRHTKYGRIRGMVVDEGGHSTGVLL